MRSVKCQESKDTTEGGDAMFLLKACPRCKGDIFVDRDNYGPFLHCMQCGYIKDLEESSKIRVHVQIPQAKEERAVARR